MKDDKVILTEVEYNTYYENKTLMYWAIKNKNYKVL